jgi:glycosyltransferase involved in cell wall biosynthesis
MNGASKAPPEISVIIPCYNAEKWVGRAIDSVLEQKGVSIEVIVIDDGSTDDSLNRILSYRDCVYSESAPNKGACAARNRGLSLAQASFVMFLDADDYIAGPFLASHYKALSQSDADVSFGAVVDQSEKTAPKLRSLPNIAFREALVADWLDGKFVPPCGILWRKRFVEEISGWDENLSKNQDGDIMFRAIMSGASFTQAPNGHGVYWHHQGSDRITGSMTLKKARDQLLVYKRLLDGLGSSKKITPPIVLALSKAVHSMERDCIRARAFDAAKLAAAFRQERKWPRYEGSISHILFARALGLKRKEKLAQFLHQIRMRKQLK